MVLPIFWVFCGFNFTVILGNCLFCKFSLGKFAKELFIPDVDLLVSIQIKSLPNLAAAQQNLAHFIQNCGDYDWKK